MYINNHLVIALFCQTLFVLGENASQCRSDDLEDLRERMKAVTGMVMVGGADDLLRVSSHKKKLEGVTQSMVDRFVCCLFILANGNCQK